MKSIMIVESPNKVKLIGKFVRPLNIQVMASIGHVRGLDISIKNKGAIEVNNGFKQHFCLNKNNAKNTKELLNKCKSADVVYLATDPDTEGEGISWHLKELIRGVNKNCEFKRVTFNEITEKHVLESIKNPRTIDQNKVDSHFGRSVSDYLYGFYVSPLLWKVLTPGLSAGRVQSPALRLIVEREQEIRKFVPTTYWTMTVFGNKDNITFPAKLVRVGDVNLGKLSFEESSFPKDVVEGYKDTITQYIGKGEKLLVSDVKRGKKSVKPKAPYRTSTLQQDAVRKLGWTTTRVMQTAQKLFEGDGKSDHGYITYMRTDSTALSQEALDNIFAFGRDNYKQYMSEHVIEYGKVAKGAQGAHEAIRPTDIYLTPTDVKNRLGNDEYKLYKLIWERTLASQMKPALFDTLSVSFTLKEFGFRSSGSVLKFAGYLAVYQEGEDLDSDKEENTKLPELEYHDKVEVVDFKCEEHQTKPPARYNEASLVKTLEDYGIGRPSTYANIIRVLKDRAYVSMDGQRFMLNDIGEQVINFLLQYFSKYIDYNYTSDLNVQLDKIASGELNWKQVMYDFWNPFYQVVERTAKEAKSVFGKIEEMAELCPKCGQHNLNLMQGKYGKYKSCPDKKCGFKESLENNRPKKEEVVFEGKKCPECNGRLLIKEGFKGRKFVGCENYSRKENPCKYSCNIDGTEKAKAVNTGTTCPSCKKGQLVIRVGKRGNFFSCNRFPKCRTIVSANDYADISGLELAEVDDLLNGK